MNTNTNENRSIDIKNHITSKKWTLNQIAEWMSGEILSTHESFFDQVSTDTRKLMEQHVFIALKGDTFDAHLFLDQAVQQKAGLLIIHELRPEFEKLKNQVSIIKVKDTLAGLQDFARCYRQTLKTRIISITGSNGKTTTKEFAATLLNQFKKTHFNQGSFNNHWGVPLTLLEIPMDAAFAVVEMGMNHSGEIKKLVSIADPDVVVCTMVGRAHIEHFGSIKDIAAAKAEIYQESSLDTIRIFNQDQDETFDMMYPVAKKFPASRMLTFSEKNDEADVYFKFESQTNKGISISGSVGGYKSQAIIPIFGQQNIINLMAASAIAYSVGMSPEKIWKSLVQCQSAWGRNEFIKSELGIDILFDGYNANPDSMSALLKNIQNFKSESIKIGVFGQMKELGDHATKEHFDLGQNAAQAGFQFIYFVGENFKHFEEGLLKENFKDYFVKENFSEEVATHFKQTIKSGDLIVIKGSRGAQTEKFVDLCKPLNWKNKLKLNLEKL